MTTTHKKLMLTQLLTIFIDLWPKKVHTKCIGCLQSFLTQFTLIWKLFFDKRL